MELGHCPFSMKCAECEDGDTYTMTDDAGRKFYLLRFKKFPLPFFRVQYAAHGQRKKKRSV